jgi:hypothetical protein
VPRSDEAGRDVVVAGEVGVCIAVALVEEEVEERDVVQVHMEPVHARPERTGGNHTPGPRTPVEKGSANTFSRHLKPIIIYISMEQRLRSYLVVSVPEHQQSVDILTASEACGANKLALRTGMLNTRSMSTAKPRPSMDNKNMFSIYTVV